MSASSTQFTLLPAAPGGVLAVMLPLLTTATLLAF
jgi:hypothetical protein